MTMLVKQITPELLPKVRIRLIRFLNLHGDKRITRKGIKWLENFRGEMLAEEGNCIITILEEKKLVGMIAVSDYGRKESFIAVHQDYRQKGTGVHLLEELMKRMDKAYGRVALDNIPSLKLCFAMGMVGFKVITGPTGKPTLWLGLGNWKKEDVEE